MTPSKLQEPAFNTNSFHSIFKLKGDVAHIDGSNEESQHVLVRNKKCCL